MSRQILSNRARPASLESQPTRRIFHVFDNAPVITTRAGVNRGKEMEMKMLARLMALAVVVAGSVGVMGCDKEATAPAAEEQAGAAKEAKEHPAQAKPKDHPAH